MPRLFEKMARTAFPASTSKQQTLTPKMLLGLTFLVCTFLAACRRRRPRAPMSWGGGGGGGGIITSLMWRPCPKHWPSFESFQTHPKPTRTAHLWRGNRPRHRPCPAPKKGRNFAQIRSAFAGAQVAICLDMVGVLMGIVGPYLSIACLHPRLEALYYRV